jgi:hypothetical protein
MNSNTRTARTLGLLLLLNLAIGYLTNLFLLGPLTFAADYLTKVSENRNQIIISLLLLFIGGCISVGIAVYLLPVFKQINKNMAMWFLSFSIISFTIITIDNISVLALFSVCKEYAKALPPEINYFKALSNVFYAIRMWTHLMVILVGCIPMFIFYLLFFQSKLLPRFLSIGGLLVSLLMLTGVLLDIFGQGLYVQLLLPAGLIRLVVALWLMIKGFSKSVTVMEI